MDNVLLAFEMIHFMKQKKSGAEGEVALNCISAKHMTAWSGSI